MADTYPMMIHKITPSVDYNKWLTLNLMSNQNKIKVPNVVKPINKKMLL